MKRLTFILFLVSLILNEAFAQCPVIPLPSSYHKADGQLDLNRLKYCVVSDPSFEGAAHYFQKKMLQYTGLTVSDLPDRNKNEGTIFIKMDKEITGEDYHLNISPVSIELAASTPHGAFNGVITLLQLIRLSTDHKIACWQIKDHSAMKWRGIMLDESRHFFGKKTVKKLLDWMAFYKLDRFHWHLTDAPGWRLQIKKYPKLALIGGIGNNTDSLAPAAYYTQEDIHEIERYAKERFIKIIPEIDMPGHATAANRAYPEYSGGGSKRYPDFTFNPGKEETYTYLTNILKEVNVLFPSKMIHLGGDEVSFGSGHWPSLSSVQQLMKQENLKDVKAVEEYFIQRMADSIIRLGSKVLGWDEISNADIPPEHAIVFWWRHDKKNALKRSLDKGYQVVLCPRIPLYWDFVQTGRDRSGRRWSGTFSDLEKVYRFALNQYREIINPQNRHLILGFQANIWTERISSVSRLQYMLFPRIAGLSEAAWTAADKRKNYEEFKERVAQHEKLYQKAGLEFYNILHPELSPEIIDEVLQK